jgi:hypothetical protein
MFKKIFIFTTFLLTGLFTFSLQTNAETTTWEITNVFSTNWWLRSACIVLLETDTVFVLDMTNGSMFNDYDSNPGGLVSEVVFYSTTTCTGTSDDIELEDKDNFGDVNKVYFFDFASELAFNPRSARIFIGQNFTSLPGGGNLATSAATTIEFFNFTPNIVRFYKDLALLEQKYYFDNVGEDLFPAPINVIKPGFSSYDWVDINGDIYYGNLPPTEDQLNNEGYFNLYAKYIKDVEYELPPGLGGPIDPPSERPIDILLFNTGFYNLQGFMLLYVFLIVGASIGLFYIKAPLLVNLIVNIVITALFMIAGYLPFYIAFIMIALFVIILIQINKGGLLNE